MMEWNRMISLPTKWTSAGQYFKIIVFVVHVTQSGDVVREGVHPDVHHMGGVKVHRDAPFEGSPGDTGPPGRA